MKKKTIYKVTFREPNIEASDQTEFYFTTLSAIYEVFDKSAIGCALNNLWNQGVAKGRRYVSRTCTIERVTVASSEHA